MTKNKSFSTTGEAHSDRTCSADSDLPNNFAKNYEGPAPEAFANIRARRDDLVQAVISRTLLDGSYQAAKWLFEFGHINAAEQSAPEDEPSLLRLLLEKLQIEETPEELAAKFAADGGALE
jgi:hypothetical protein